MLPTYLTLLALANGFAPISTVLMRLPLASRRGEPPAGSGQNASPADTDPCTTRPCWLEAPQGRRMQDCATSRQELLSPQSSAIFTWQKRQSRAFQELVVQSAPSDLLLPVRPGSPRPSVPPTDGRLLLSGHTPGQSAAARSASSFGWSGRMQDIP